MQNDTSFEVRWSLSELEDIVFEFINAHQLPEEFNVPSPLQFEDKKATVKRSAAHVNFSAEVEAKEKKDAAAGKKDG